MCNTNNIEKDNKEFYTEIVNEISEIQMLTRFLTDSTYLILKEGIDASDDKEKIISGSSLVSEWINERLEKVKQEFELRITRKLDKMN